MIDRTHDLPITRQARALNISRGSVYYLPRPVPEADLAIMRRLDRLHLEFPFAGSPNVARPAGCRGVQDRPSSCEVEAAESKPRRRVAPSGGGFLSRAPARPLLKRAAPPKRG
jgi:hypothetical protein